MTTPTTPARPQPIRRRTRPTTEYWDVFSASWQTRRPVVPEPRRGD